MTLKKTASAIALGNLFYFKLYACLFWSFFVEIIVYRGNTVQILNSSKRKYIIKIVINKTFLNETKNYQLN